MVALAMIVWIWRDHRGAEARARPPETRSSAPTTYARHVLIEEGTHVEFSADALFTVHPTRDPPKVSITLEQGVARFDVAHDPTRSFEVVASPVTVRVIGTAFIVEKYGSNIRVSVQRGRVELALGKRTFALAEGESWSSRDEIAPGASSVDEAATAAPPGAPSADDHHEEVPTDAGSAPAHARATSTAEPDVGRDWRTLAREQDYDRAFVAMNLGGTTSTRDEPDDLMLAADVARLSRHAAKAVAPLRKLMANHPGDPRAPLAAFTLGRVYLDQLGQPREAAAAFARAQALDPGGQLAEDGLAREVEAWSRAGEPQRAQERANAYLKRYPAGRRATAVRRNGGLD
jgi:transmembrane sensor